MQELTDDQINQQDYVDNVIFDLIQMLNPTSNEIKWDIEIIAEIRDTIERYFVQQKICSNYDFYPYLKE